MNLRSLVFFHSTKGIVWWFQDSKNPFPFENAVRAGSPLSGLSFSLSQLENEDRSLADLPPRVDFDAKCFRLSIVADEISEGTKSSFFFYRWGPRSPPQKQITTSTVIDATSVCSLTIQSSSIKS